MFGVDEGADAAALLRFADDVQRKGGFARRFRAVNLNHAAARKTADAKRDVEPERGGRDRLDFDRFLVLAQAHDRAFAERAFDLRKRGLERLGLVHGSPLDDAKIWLSHSSSPYSLGRLGQINTAAEPL